jgi:hypothetical protein
VRCPSSDLKPPAGAERIDEEETKGADEIAITPPTAGCRCLPPDLAVHHGLIFGRKGCQGIRTGYAPDYAIRYP